MPKKQVYQQSMFSIEQSQFMKYTIQ